MNETINISIILPIESSKHKNFIDYFNNAIKSIKSQSLPPNELVIVHTGEDGLKTILEDYDFNDMVTKVNIYQNDGDSDFQSQINFGVSKATSDWISIFEFDDEYANIWFKNVKKYMDAYENIDGFLPIVVDVDNKGVFAGFTNEATFAANINTDISKLSNDVLLNYQNFQTSGMVLKKSIYEQYGGFKKSMKLTFVYEFLLRLTYNSVEIMTIPRIGYKHSNMREGSIFWNYKNGENSLTEDEVKFWLESAKKESFFTNDRNIKYEPENV